MKQYSGEFNADNAHGHGYELLTRSGVDRGVVLDLGCATGGLAEPVTDLGLDYVGADIDRAALDELAARGFEAHELDLRLEEDELFAALSSMIGGRGVAAVFLLDVIEHLVDPGPTLRAISRLPVAGDGQPRLIVSIPNVTHVDVAVKLLAGRWDLTKIGLLDDTHLRFFTDQRVRETMAESGWGEVDAYDVVNPFSDQMFPVDAPVLRPGTPLRQLLWRVRTSADGFGETYQYVRSYQHGLTGDETAPAAALSGFDRADADAPFLSIVVHATGVTDAGALAGDLAAQTDQDFEVLVSRDRGVDAPHPLDAAGVRVRRLDDEPDWRNVALATAAGRYVAFVDDQTRLAPHYVEAVRRAAEQLPSRVVQTGVYQLGGISPADHGGEESFAAITSGLSPVDLDPLDLVSTQPLAAVALAAYAIPRQVHATTGLRFAGGPGLGQLSLFLLRAVELCGIIRSDEIVGAVDAGAVRDLGADLAYIQDQVGRAPMLIPEGAGSYLLHMRATHAALVAERDDLASRLHATNQQVGTLSSLVRERDDDLARLKADAEGLRAADERRLSTKLRRRIGPIARSI